VYDGKNAAAVLKSVPKSTYVGVDLWDAPGEDFLKGLHSCEHCTPEFMAKIQAEAHERLQGYQAMLYRGAWSKAAANFPDFMADLIFVDGDHRVHQVWDDIVTAFRLVKPGRILMGHDFTPSWFETVVGVMSAADMLRRQPRGSMISQAIELSSDGTWWFSVL